MLEADPPPIMEKPDILITSFTYGIFFTSAESASTVFSVRSFDAPVGSWMEVMKYPISSEGM